MKKLGGGLVRASLSPSPRHSLERPLDHECRDLVLNLSRLGALNWCLGKHREDFCYASIANPVGEAGRWGGGGGGEGEERGRGMGRRGKGGKYSHTRLYSVRNICGGI